MLKNLNSHKKLDTMRILISLFSAIIFLGCGGGSGPAANLAGYETETIPGGDVIRAYKATGNGVLVEEGYVSNGKRNGIWITYHPEGDRIKTITSYSDGQLNGPYLELSNRGQIESKVNYKNGKYDGLFATYKFGRPTKEVYYKDNQLHGTTKEYFQKGTVQKEINFKNGKQDGLMRYYNEDGEVTVEYQYKNGEKVSGGIVEPKDE